MLSRAYRGVVGTSSEAKLSGFLVISPRRAQRSYSVTDAFHSIENVFIGMLVKLDANKNIETKFDAIPCRYHGRLRVADGINRGCLGSQTRTLTLTLTVRTRLNRLNNFNTDAVKNS